MVINILGQHQVKVSPKGRVAFPKKFREGLGEKIIITRGYEGCLIAVSENEWATITKETETGSFIFGPTRDTTRFLLGNASLVELDEQGRFVVPPHLRNYSEIESEAIFLGLSRYVEIWSKDKWQEYQEYLNKNIGKISERLTENKNG
jgi:MraZ protein